MEIQALEVQCYEISTDTHNFGLFRIVDEWNGIKKLKSLDSDSVILAMSAQTNLQLQMAKVFSNILKQDQKEPWAIVACSPDIALILKEGS